MYMRPRVYLILIAVQTIHLSLPTPLLSMFIDLCCMLRCDLHSDLMQAVDFTWDPSDIRQPIPLTSSGIVSVHPLKGRLDAKQSRLFRLTVSAECGPRFLGPTPLACLVRQAPPSQVSKCANADCSLPRHFRRVSEVHRLRLHRLPWDLGNGGDAHTGITVQLMQTRVTTQLWCVSSDISGNQFFRQHVAKVNITPELRNPFHPYRCPRAFPCFKGHSL